MTKTYNSQETIDTILTVAAKLFLEKGFDRTSMMDIARTGGISKGAIYHHFQSKDEIIKTVMDKQAQMIETTMRQWLLEMKSLTGREKLTALLEKNYESLEAHLLDDIVSSRIKSPEFVVSYMQDIVNKDAVFIAEIMKAGVVDGSLNTDFPEECGEVFLLLLNLWCDPVVFSCNLEKLEKRIKFLQQLMKGQGVDILEDSFVTKMLVLLQKLYPEEAR